MSCPVIDHLACKLPGNLDPRPYMVYAQFTLAAGQFIPRAAIPIGNRDAPFHAASLAFVDLAGTGRLVLRPYDATGYGVTEDLVPVESFAGGLNAQRPIFPSLVWPVNGSLSVDLRNTGGAGGTWGLLWCGFRLYDRGKAPC